MLGEQTHRLGQQLRRGLVAGHEQLLHDAQHLGHVEGPRVGDLRIVVVDARLQERGQQVVLGLDLASLELGGEVVLVLVHAALGLESLLEGDVGSDPGDRVVGPALEVVHP